MQKILDRDYSHVLSSLSSPKKILVHNFDKKKKNQPNCLLSLQHRSNILKLSPNYNDVFASFS